jgi:GMP synthase (glutamine-hydrolysing)
MEHFSVPSLVESIRTSVPAGEAAVVMVSGGVDSAVAAVLAHRALGGSARFHFIDNGLQRKGEKEKVADVFRSLGIEVSVSEDSSFFLKRISKAATGGRKRDILSYLLVRRALGIAHREHSRILVFGTIKNDLMVCDCNSSTIPGFTLIEPLKDLEKEEVVRLAKSLDIPDVFTGRQHFPGVGFAVRVGGRLTRRKLILVRDLTEIVEDAVREAGLNERLWGYFPFLLEKKSKEKYSVVLRIVQSQLGVTAEIPDIPINALITIRDEMLRRKPEIGRVYFDLTPKPVSLIEYM